MSSTSASSTSSAPRTASQSSQAAGSQLDSEAGWSTRYTQVRPKTTLPWILVAYAAGGSLPGTIKKMTRDPREAPTGLLRLGRKDWFFFGKETRLFWVSQRGVWDQSSQSLDGDADKDGEGTVAMTPPDIPPLGLSESFLFPMPRPNAHLAHEQPPTNTTAATKPWGDFSNGFAGRPSATSYRGGFNSLPRASSPGVGFGMAPVGRKT